MVILPPRFGAADEVGTAVGGTAVGAGGLVAGTWVGAGTLVATGAEVAAALVGAGALVGVGAGAQATMARMSAINETNRTIRLTCIANPPENIWIGKIPKTRKQIPGFFKKPGI
jgi:carbonic anhydrase/acetyltransferase-like protein (isoleucine patch superfamily)